MLMGALTAAMIWLHCWKFGELRSSNSWVKLILVDEQFSCVRLAAPLLDTEESVLSFVGTGAIFAQFCFTYLLGGITAMQRGLHARLCHAFL